MKRESNVMNLRTARSRSSTHLFPNSSALQAAAWAVFNSFFSFIKLSPFLASTRHFFLFFSSCHLFFSSIIFPAKMYIHKTKTMKKNNIISILLKCTETNNLPDRRLRDIWDSDCLLHIANKTYQKPVSSFRLPQ